MKLFENGIRIQVDIRKLTVGVIVASIYFGLLAMAVAALVRELPKVG